MQKYVKKLKSPVTAAVRGFIKNLYDLPNGYAP